MYEKMSGDVFARGVVLWMSNAQTNLGRYVCGAIVSTFPTKAVAATVQALSTKGFMKGRFSPSSMRSHAAFAVKSFEDH